MNLADRNRANMDQMIQEIREKLQVVNQDLLRSEDFPLSAYDQLHDVYNLLDRLDSVSPYQIEAILQELGTIRNPS